MSDDHEASRVGFAKLKGKDFEYFMQKYEVKLGRQSKSSQVDLVLGDERMMNISRHHASIIYNFDTRSFQLKVLGKNGVKVSNRFYSPADEPPTLRSQDLIGIGDSLFYFLLPPSHKGGKGKGGKGGGRAPRAFDGPTPTGKRGAPRDFNSEPPVKKQRGHMPKGHMPAPADYQMAYE
mmetsp:Transcript_27938/g.33938  ORF Transcript_27938/g.33938 Transcript_27938/m.33938 type:complete len:178 (-) Transcript_27938:903-1436(-)